ncbi:MAG: LysM peptidoglycan-binding domain-containing protein [Agathobacter sp.]|nr:LysM peptidoglycan-binding domain-containing protein [Agathobacter sp.]
MRAYNDKLSEKVNSQLAKRERTVRFQKRFIAVAGILIISLVIILGTSIRAFASSHNEKKQIYKYYTSVEVESGDTLWSLADTYIDQYNINKSDYINEVCSLNQLQDGQIHAGQHIIVAYYSTELK